MAGEAPPVDPAVTRAIGLVSLLWNDADLGAKVRAKAKEKYPEITIPEEGLAPSLKPLQDEIASLKDALKKVETDRADERKKREEAETTSSIEQKIAAARAKYNLTDEGLDKLVARMKEAGGADIEAAAAWVVSQNPPPAPPKNTYGPSRLSLFKGDVAEDKRKQLLTDWEGYFDGEMNEFVGDPDKYVRDTFGVAA